MLSKERWAYLKNQRPKRVLERDGHVVILSPAKIAAEWVELCDEVERLERLQAEVAGVRQPRMLKDG